MSRIGKVPVPVPAGVDVAIDGANVTVKGPKGTLSHTVAAPIKVAQEDGTLMKVMQGDGSKGVQVGTRIAVIAEDVPS